MFIIYIIYIIIIIIFIINVAVNVMDVELTRLVEGGLSIVINLITN